jgi:hypothetical protein
MGRRPDNRSGRYGDDFIKVKLWTLTYMNVYADEFGTFIFTTEKAAMDAAEDINKDQFFVTVEDHEIEVWDRATGSWLPDLVPEWN